VDFFRPYDDRKNKMKNLAHLTILTILLTCLIAPLEAMAQDKSCWFEAAGPDDVYLMIREKTGPDESREIVVWEGWIKKYQQKQFTSQTGEIRYDYRLSSDNRTYGDNHRSCEDGNIIRIP
jgi:hypothetical protein